MTLSPIDAQVFVSALAAVLLVLMVAFFGLSALLWLSDRLKSALKRKPTAEIPAGKQAPAAKSAPVPVQAPAKQLPAPKPVPIAKPAEAKPAPAAKPVSLPAQKPMPAQVIPSVQSPALARLKINADAKNASRFEIFDANSNAKFGVALLSPAWEGAAMPSLALSPNESRFLLEVRPLRAREEGALCTILDDTGAEAGLVASVHMKEGWSSPPPKPIYAGGKISAEFRSIEVGGGLVSASLSDASKKEIGSLQRSAPGEWEFRMLPGSEKTIAPNAALLCAIQLIAEQAGK